MNKSPLSSLCEIQKALEQPDCKPHMIIIRGKAFFRSAANNADEEVKQFLIQMVERKIVTANDQSAAVEAIQWLSQYRDPTLLPFFRKLLHNEKLQYWAIQALAILKDIRAAEPLAALLALTTNHYDISHLIGALHALSAVTEIDLVASYLNHPFFRVRMDALSAVLNLSKLAGSDEKAKLVLPLLDDSNNAVRQLAAIILYHDFPHLVPELDLKSYFPQKTNVSRTQKES